ncbi:uncharacterized protein [Euwallacea fornicatus]|uniref:uncharacterized protein isoform X1 n=2 Tax=Euwallacea fornicatus TaxID=995702 RepID=UPI00338EC78E
MICLFQVKMQHLSEISFTFLNNQICTNCRQPITCGPVYLINDLSILCGRCRMTAKDHYRNFAYEALARAFVYPCRNWKKHCSIKLEWNESLTHEMECDYDGCCDLLCCHPGAFFKGQRETPFDEPRWTMVPENFLDELECVLCGGYLNSAPIFLQSNGQNVCHRCIYTNGTPPNCRRNYAYEDFAQIFLFPCSYRNRGCKERLPFGKEVWKHESQCEYGSNQQRVEKDLRQRQVDEARASLRPVQNQPSHFTTNQPNPPASSDNKPRKEKGLVQTHTGHVWATITPQKALFAPPDDYTDQANKNLLKSLVKKHEKQRRRADDVYNNVNARRFSDCESVSTNESFGQKGSGYSTPDHLEPPRRPYYDRQPPLEYARQNSVDSEAPPHPSQYPILQPHQLNERFDAIPRDSYRGSIKRESSRGNTCLINELKLKQDQIKRTHSIKTEKPANGLVYRQGGNLEGISENYRQY